ncbi:MAG TPA: 2-dehydro-3-deoxygalactonokinase [Steroidobacteraceae bacterium]|nr:2-dehydro-3-deoxygalactonokinase [Steroidobacteraceae bacterium]
MVGIDWGSTRLRAFRFSPAGSIQEMRESDRGITALADGTFDHALTSILHDWPRDLPIIMCGMVGSRQGWREVPYCACPAQLEALSQCLGKVQTSVGRAWIVAGLSVTTQCNDRLLQNASPFYDVMRGEESQIAGVAPPTGDLLIVTPGTHSKWTWVQGSTVQSFRTYLTGELYAVLRDHSMLGKLMERHNAPSAEPVFIDGVHTAFADQDLLHCLFNVRTEGLFKRKSPATLSSYLSGILIGSEVAAARRHYAADSAILIASAELGHLYRLAMQAAGMRSVTLVDANEAVARGLWRLWQLRGASG